MTINCSTFFTPIKHKDGGMLVTSLTYTRAAKVADPVNRYENHDVTVTATIQGEWNDVAWSEGVSVNEADEAMADLKDWVLKHIREDVQQIREAG
jgi:hypothetical protein